jgi:Protein of unknown function (DUF421)
VNGPANGPLTRCFDSSTAGIEHSPWHSIAGRLFLRKPFSTSTHSEPSSGSHDNPDTFPRWGFSMAAAVRAFLGYFFLVFIVRTPVILLQKDEWQLEVMRRTRIDPEDVMAAARTKGVNSIHDVDYAILERNGGISIIKAQK